MPDCVCLERCPFFNDSMKSKPATAEIFKRHYCKNDFSACARYKVFKVLGREKVPADLYPNELDRVDGILAKP